MSEATRLAALETVVKAARELRRRGIMDEPLTKSTDDLCDALAALDALPAPQPVETVTLAVWRSEYSQIHFRMVGTEADRPHFGWTRLGSVTLALDPEAPK